MRVSTIYSAAGLEIVTQPFLVTSKLEALAQRASEDFIKSLNLPKDGPTPVALEILVCIVCALCACVHVLRARLRAGRRARARARACG